MSASEEENSLAKIRHDLRTPINHILGFSELLGEDLADRGLDAPEDLGKVQAAARQLLALIDSRLSDANLSGSAEPKPADATKEIPPASITLPAAAPGGHFSTLTGSILVVDDDSENRAVLVRRLQRQGHRAAEATDGLHALEMLAAHSYDLVLLDVMMPAMDGFTALGKMKADPATRHIPVIMISALDEIENVVRCIESGAEDFLSKPFNPTLLRARIGASLEKKTFRDHEQAYLRRIEETQSRLEVELHEAAKYIVSILPPPVDAPFPIAWAYDPCTELGGDSFGYHWIDDSHFAIYLLDVCGHGVGAALLSVAAINVLRSASLKNVDFRDPSQVLAGLNDTFQMERHNNMYFTIWYGVYHASTRTLRFASAGHPPAILLAPDQTAADHIAPLACSGMLIGVMPKMTYDSATAAIPHDARLFVYCDGAYEIKRPDGHMISYDDDFLPFLQKNGRSKTLPEDVLAWIHTIHTAPDLDDDYSFLTVDFPAT